MRALCVVALWALACGGEPPRTEQPSTEPVQTEEPETERGACSLVGRFTLLDDGQPEVVGPEGQRPIGISKEYTFDPETYRMEGYPPLVITGRYRVAAWDGMRARVEWTATIFDGSPQDDRESWLTFTDCDHFAMDGMSYGRVPTN